MKIRLNFFFLHPPPPPPPPHGPPHEPTHKPPPSTRARETNQASSVAEDRHRPRPTRRSPMHLHREAHHVEPVRRQRRQVPQLLHLEIPDLPPRAMAFPDQADISRLL